MIDQEISVGWRNINPGAGGQIQYVTCDPSQPGRFYLCSDMEGWYLSNDYGQTWQYRGQNVPSGNTIRVEAEPGNPQRLYLGHSYGLAISDDDGHHWRSVTELDDIVIGTIAISTTDRNRVAVGNSWLEDESMIKRVQGGEDGERFVHISHDRGETWRAISYTHEIGNRHLYTITFHPNDADKMIIGADAGIFHSEDGGLNWTAISAPESMVSSRGCDITLDGKYLYGVYVDENEKSRVYRREYPVGNGWQRLEAPLLDTSPTSHWRPVIDPSSTETEHRLLIGPLLTPNDGLYEMCVRNKGEEFDAKITKVLDTPQPYDDTPFAFDFGWNHFEPMCRTYNYYPLTWQRPRHVLAMVQQQVFIGDMDQPYTSWECVTSQFVWEYGSIQFHRHRGTSSTYVYDMEAIGDYVVQAQADNGVLESYDAGYSWTQDTHPGKLGATMSNVEGIGIIPLDPPLILVGAIGNQWGGGDIESGCDLWAKVLTNRKLPTDEWWLVASGKAGAVGLPDKRIHVVIPDPHHPQCVYVGTQAGLYAVDDVSPLVKHKLVQFHDIGGDVLQETSIRKVFVDPYQLDTLYVMGGARTVEGLRIGATGIWRGKKLSETYHWTRIHDKGCAGNGLGDFTVWGNDGQTILVASLELFNRPEFGGDCELVWSLDNGETWETILTVAAAFDLLPPVAHWYNPERHEIQMSGLVGHENKLYLSVFSRRVQQTVGFLRGTVTSSCGMQWDDWTGPKGDTLLFPYSRRGKVWEDSSGIRHILQATMGMGLWSRVIS